MYEYDLFAVINHDGNMTNGHYTNYARSGEQVSLCDQIFTTQTDSACSGIASTMTSGFRLFRSMLSSNTFDRVTISSLGECLQSNAYMCFYVKRRLEYKAHTRPTYVLTRETEAVREKEREAAKNKEIDEGLLALL